MPFIPLFPLNIVPFPKEKLNLHIFEPRYIQLVNECVANDSFFGIPVVLKNKVTNYGTLMRVKAVKKTYKAGTMDISTYGIRVFKIHQFKSVVPDKLYAGGDVELLPNIDDGDKQLGRRIHALISKMYEVMDIKRRVDTTYSFAVAHHIGMTTKQEYTLLQITSEAERQRYILAHLQQIIPIVIETENMRKKIQMNGHFKNLPPLKW